MNSCNFLIHNINREIARSLPYKGRVIDLGCGIGPYKHDILKTADEYIGVDWEKSYHEDSHVTVHADLTKRFPFDDAYADTLVSFQVMEHLPEPDFFLSECFRILKPNGNLFMTVPFIWPVHEAPYDYYRYTRHGLEYLFRKNGFADIRITENTGFWQIWVLELNYHTARYTSGPLKYLFFPLWWLGQVIAPLLDKIDKNFTMCASYTVTARKP